MFDTIIGTSTGGLIALGLAVTDQKTGKPKMTAADFIDIYENQAKNIFKSSFFRQGLFRSRYDHTGLEDLLEGKFGNATLKDAGTNVVVTSFDMKNTKPFYFSTADARKNNTLNFYMKDAGRATSAAPSYFAPAQIYSVADPAHNMPYYLLDGGVIMNNPALLGYFTAHKDFQDVDSLLLVSLGTGDTRKGAQGSDLEGGGVLFWASSLVDIMMDGASAVNDQLLQSHFLQKTSPGSYYRLQAVLHPDLHEMDTKDRAQLLPAKAGRLDNACKAD